MTIQGHGAQASAALYGRASLKGVLAIWRFFDKQFLEEPYIAKILGNKSKRLSKFSIAENESNPQEKKVLST